MSKKEKLTQKFLKNPGSIKYAELKLILISYGFQEIPVRGGSHRKFKHSLLSQDLVIPVHNNDCKKFYKKKASRIIQTNKLNK